MQYFQESHFWRKVIKMFTKTRRNHTTQKMNAPYFGKRQIKVFAKTSVTEGSTKEFWPIENIIFLLKRSVWPLLVQK